MLVVAVAALHGLLLDEALRKATPQRAGVSRVEPASSRTALAGPPGLHVWKLGPAEAAARFEAARGPVGQGAERGPAAAGAEARGAAADGAHAQGPAAEAAHAQGPAAGGAQAQGPAAASAQARDPVAPGAKTQVSLPAAAGPGPQAQGLWVSTLAPQAPARTAPGREPDVQKLAPATGAGEARRPRKPEAVGQPSATPASRAAARDEPAQRTRQPGPGARSPAASPAAADVLAASPASTDGLAVPAGPRRAAAPLLSVRGEAGSTAASEAAVLLEAAYAVSSGAEPAAGGGDETKAASSTEGTTPTAAPSAEPSPPAASPAATATSIQTSPSPAASASPEPLPVYPTRIPSAFSFGYDMRRGMISGRGSLSFKLDGAGGYEARLEGSVAGFSILQWVSRGRIDSHGLAPVRFTDQRRGRGVQAANFQREAGRITYSGTKEEVPLPEGAQDRLSWMLQLAAIARARPERLREGEHVTLFVSGARADADAWSFQVGAPLTLEVPAGRIEGALPLLREPRKDYDTRAQVWLDPARQYLPVKARLQSSREGGEALELLLEAVLPPP